MINLAAKFLVHKYTSPFSKVVPPTNDTNTRSFFPTFAPEAGVTLAMASSYPTLHPIHWTIFCGPTHWAIFCCCCSYVCFFVFVFPYDFLLLMFLLFLLLPFLLAGIFELARAGNIAQRCRGLCWCCVYLLCFTLFCFVSYYTFLHRVFVFILPAFLFLILFLLLLRIVVFVFAFAFYKQTLFVLCRFFSPPR